MSSEHNDIEKIRESFESANRDVPEFVWENVSRQLYIDRVWMHMKPRLDRIQRKRKRGFLFLISGGFLLLIAGVFFILNQTGKNTDTPCKYIRHSSSLLTAPAFKKQTDALNNQISSTDSARTRFATASLYRTSKTTNIVYSSSVHVNSSVESKQSFPSDSLISAGKTDSPENVPSTVIPNTIEFDPLVYAEHRSLSFVPYNSGLPAQMQLRGDTSHREKFLSFEAGVLYTLSNPIIINSDFKEGNSRESLTSLVPSLTSGYGILFSVIRPDDQLIEAEFFIRSALQQKSRAYEKGKYIEKTTRLDYSKFALLYQKKFSVKKYNPLSSFIIGGGAYLSYLKKGNTDLHYEGTLIGSSNTKYRSTDYGLKMVAGFEKELGFFVLGTGFHAELGLKNIFAGDALIPVDFNRTTLFSHGFYALIKYRF